MEKSAIRKEFAFKCHRTLIELDGEFQLQHVSRVDRL